MAAAPSVDQAVLAQLAQNRPFSLQNLVDLLAHAGWKKAAITKSLDTLVECGKITAKEFGKTKLFLPPQTGLAVLSPEEMADKRSQTKALQEQLQAEKDGLRAAEAELSTWRSSLSVEDMAAEISTYTAKLADAERRLQPLRSGATLVSAEERAAAAKALATMLDHWRRRRKIFKDVWSTLSESLEGKKEVDMFEEMGVDTDEAVGAPDMKVLEALTSTAAKRRKL